MKKLVSWILASVFAVSAAIALSACSKQERITVAIPNDTTNEARALLLIQGHLKRLFLKKCMA